MNDTKTLEEWEYQYSVMLLDATPETLQQTLTEEEFLQRRTPDNMWGVLHDERKEFLVNNGYDVTRENMLNIELSTRVANAPADAAEQQPPADPNISVI